MKNVNHVINPRQINDAIPGSFILIAQFKNASANGRQRPVIAWALALLQLPKLESEVLSYVLRERLENLPGVALPSDGRVPGDFCSVVHEGEYSRKCRVPIYNKMYMSVNQEFAELCRRSAGANDFCAARPSRGANEGRGRMFRRRGEGGGGGRFGGGGGGVGVEALFVEEEDAGAEGEEHDGEAGGDAETGDDGSGTIVAAADNDVAGDGNQKLEDAAFQEPGEEPGHNRGRISKIEIEENSPEQPEDKAEAPDISFRGKVGVPKLIA